MIWIVLVPTIAVALVFIWVTIGFLSFKWDWARITFNVIGFCLLAMVLLLLVGLLIYLWSIYGSR